MSARDTCVTGIVRALVLVCWHRSHEKMEITWRGHRGTSRDPEELLDCNKALKKSGAVIFAPIKNLGVVLFTSLRVVQCTDPAL